MIVVGNFVVVDLPKDMVAEFSVEGFYFVYRIEIEQEFVDVAEVGGNSVRQDY